MASAGDRVPLLDAAQGSITLKDQSCPDWFAPNADGAGYYRTRLGGPGVEESHLAPGGLAAWRADR